jgi:hypothetical protein
MFFDTPTRTALLALALVGCTGPEGPAGSDGATGPMGDPGVAGDPGAPGNDGEDGDDGMDGAPGFSPSAWWVAHNGSADAGTSTLRTASWGEIASFDGGTNEGLAFDRGNNLVQAGDGSVVALRTFCDPVSASSYDAMRDREVMGAATTLMNPKGIAMAHAAGVVLVADVGDGTVKAFGAAAAGDVAPLATLTLPTSAWDLHYEEEADRLFLAMTDGTVGVIDGFEAGGWAGPVDRVITPVDSGGTAIGTNLHGIDYDAATDTLVVTDVGAANAAASPDFASDGSIYVLAGASSADGMVEPIRVIEGPATQLGNPVDLVLDGGDARIAEKAGGMLLVFRDVMSGTSGDIAPDWWAMASAPESLAPMPEPLSMDNPTDIVDPTTPTLGLYVTQNPAVGSPESGMVRRVSKNLASDAMAFDATVASGENITFATSGDAWMTFDDGATSGGIAVLNRVATRMGGTLDTGMDRTITGPNTGLVAPKGIEVVDRLGIVLVADFGTGATDAAVRVFSACAAGDVAPLAVVDTAGSRPWDLDHDIASDTLYAAFTDGTVGVYENFSMDLGAGGPDRTITPTDGTSQVSVNLHSIRYDASTDSLILADVGLAGDATDGALFTIGFAATADGDTPVEKEVSGILTGLGNPVDIAYDGRDLYVAEKANGAVLVYRDWLYTAGGPVVADDSLLMTAPESVVLAPALR